MKYVGNWLGNWLGKFAGVTPTQAAWAGRWPANYVGNWFGPANGQALPNPNPDEDERFLSVRSALLANKIVLSRIAGFCGDDPQVGNRVTGVVAGVHSSGKRIIAFGKQQCDAATTNLHVGQNYLGLVAGQHEASSKRILATTCKNCQLNCCFCTHPPELPYQYIIGTPVTPCKSLMVTVAGEFLKGFPYGTRPGSLTVECLASEPVGFPPTYVNYCCRPWPPPERPDLGEAYSKTWTRWSGFSPALSLGDTNRYLMTVYVYCGAYPFTNEPIDGLYVEIYITWYQDYQNPGAMFIPFQIKCQIPDYTCGPLAAALDFAGWEEVATLPFPPTSIAQCVARAVPWYKPTFNDSAINVYVNQAV